MEKILVQKKLDDINKKVEAANNVTELLSVLKLIKSSNLRFRNEKLAAYYIPIYFLVFLIVFLIFAGFFANMSFDQVQTSFFFIFSSALVAMVFGWYVLTQVSSTEEISDKIILKKVVLDNNLIFDKSNKDELLKHLEDTLFIFQLGDHSRDLVRYIRGEWDNRLAYHYFHFHYVDESSSTSNDSNGKETSDTSYDDNDLYGIITAFSAKHYIKISNYEAYSTPEKSIEWKTSSISFNQKFKVYTDNELAVAIFLQPTIIDKIEKLYETFPELDIEISPKGLLSLSTPDEELLNHTRQHGVDQLDLFKQELTKVLDQTKLHKALEFIDFLQEYQR